MTANRKYEVVLAKWEGWKCEIVTAELFCENEEEVRQWANINTCLGGPELVKILEVKER